MILFLNAAFGSAINTILYFYFISYFPFKDALVLYLQKVGEAAPNSPMYYYHIPAKTGVSLSMEELVERASTDLPTFRGLKYTHGDLMQLSRIGELQGGKYNLMYGEDQVSDVGGALIWNWDCIVCFCFSFPYMYTRYTVHVPISLCTSIV